ncbi:MAG: DUF4167 domain-containing protein [Kiloniellaceae bacterium]
MRQGSNSGRRPRGRTNRKQHGGGGGQSGTRTFDSNGPDGRVRGNARQVFEKYLSLARDATSAGDRVAAEAYYQYAEHYFRILSDSTDPTSSGRRPDERPSQPYGHDESYYGNDDDDDGPVNGNGDGERQHEARNNGNVQPQAPRDSGQRESGQRDSGQRESGRRESGPRESAQRDSGQRDSGPRDSGPRDSGPRDSGPRDSGQRDSGQRDSGPRDSGRRDSAPRDAAPREGARVPVEAVAPAVEVQAQPRIDDGEAPPRPRRGRPRKPRPDDDGQPVKQDTTPETESGPAAS